MRSVDPGSLAVRDAVKERTMTPAQAKEKVFAHWRDLEAFSRRRFPSNDNLTQEGLNYVLDRLEADDWRRARTWNGEGNFRTFIITVTSRLLTDFQRAKFGHVRKPVWLQGEKDPIWHVAYQRLYVEDWKRQEVIEQLRTTYPDKQRWFIEEVVATVREKCRNRPRYEETNISIDDSGDLPDVTSGPEQQHELTDEELLDGLRRFLQDLKELDSSVTPRVLAVVARLKGMLDLSEEDRLLLRLYYVDGVSMPTIKKMLNLHGDPYKRCKRLIKQLGEVCREAGWG